MRTVALLSSLAVVLSLPGCGGGKAPDEPADDHALLDAAQAPLEKAREVEDISAGRKAQLDEEIDQADQ